MRADRDTAKQSLRVITGNAPCSSCTGGEPECEADPCMVDEDVIKRINNYWPYSGWRAANYSQFWGRKARDGLRLRTGTFNPEPLVSIGRTGLTVAIADGTM